MSEDHAALEPAEPSASDPEPVDEERESVGQGVKRIGLGLLKLSGLLLPVILISLVGGVIGLIGGLVAGTAATAQLFSGPGPWARAGPIALLFPVIAFLGPALLGVLAGVFGPPPIVLLVESGILAFPKFRDRHVVVWATTLAYWLPMAPAAIADGPSAGLAMVWVAGPFTGALGLLASTAWLASRGILHGRSLAEWWREADKSMLVTAALLTTVGMLIVWLSCVLVCLLPIAPVALLGSLVLSLRLVVLGRRRGVASALVVLDLLHLAVLVAAVAFAMSSDSGGSP